MAAVTPGSARQRLRRLRRRWLRWEPCREYEGCHKLLLLASPWPIPVDVYVLRYRDGAEILPHRDPVPAGRHYRLNVILWRPPAGGDFRCAEAIVDRPRLKLFRADTATHAVTRVEGGSRYVLSVGWRLP